MIVLRSGTTADGLKQKTRHLGGFQGIHGTVWDGLWNRLRMVAGGGNRTHTPLRIIDFESIALYRSATPAHTLPSDYSGIAAVESQGVPQVVEYVTG